MRSSLILSLLFFFSVIVLSSSALNYNNTVIQHWNDTDADTDFQVYFYYNNMVTYTVNNNNGSYSLYLSSLSVGLLNNSEWVEYVPMLDVSPYALLSYWVTSYNADTLNYTLTPSNYSVSSVKLVNHRPSENTTTNVKMDIYINDYVPLKYHNDSQIALIFSLYDNYNKKANLSMDGDYSVVLPSGGFLSFNTAKQATFNASSGEESLAMTIQIKNNDIYVIYDAFKGDLTHDPIYGTGDIPSGGLAWWVWLLIGIGVALVILIIIIGIMLVIKNQRKTEYERIE